MAGTEEGSHFQGRLLVTCDCLCAALWAHPLWSACSPAVPCPAMRPGGWASSTALLPEIPPLSWWPHWLHLPRRGRQVLVPMLGFSLALWPTGGCSVGTDPRGPDTSQIKQGQLTKHTGGPVSHFVLKENRERRLYMCFFLKVFKKYSCYWSSLGLAIACGLLVTACGL